MPTDFYGRVMEVFHRYGMSMLQGAGTSQQIALVGTLAGCIIGFAVGVIQTIPSEKGDNPIKRAVLWVIKVILNAYVEFFRGTPMIVQAMIVYYGLRQSGVELSSVAAGVLVTVLNTGAYMAETVRAGINSIDTGQREGALAMGMSPLKTMLFIVLPQAFRNILPEMANTFLTNLKMTSVLNVIAVQELFMAAKTAGANYYKYYEAYLVIAVIYFVLCFVFSRLFSLIEKKMEGRKDYVLAVEYMEAQ